MDDREKLIELLMQKGFGVEGATIAADHLIANGVTFATDNNVGDKMTPTDKDTNVLTKADRIRAMSDEELCKFLGEYKFCDICEEGCDSCTYNGECDKRLLEWLKQPSEVDDGQA